MMGIEIEHQPIAVGSEKIRGQHHQRVCAEILGLFARGDGGVGAGVPGRSHQGGAPVHARDDTPQHARPLVAEQGVSFARVSEQPEPVRALFEEVID
jgi:hypothetical protein